MRRWFLLTGLCLSLLGMMLPTPAAAQQPGVSCANYDAWEWAQAVYESDPDEYSALDSDGDGDACPNLPRGGFAPAFWTDRIPEDVEEAEIIRIIDGDTFEVLLDGVSNRVRILRADTPETQNETHCGGDEATAFAEFALSFNDDDVVYLERDVTERDQFGRELAYVWFEVDGNPYLLNHVLINNGWAEDVDYGDRLYDQEFQDAAAFAERHDLGVYGLCGAFELPLTDSQPAPEEPVGNTTVPVAPQPAQPEPAQPAPAQDSNCDPNYTPCIPAYPPDLDCGQIGFAVQVIGSDPHGLDRDNDGSGCE